ncbi:MAG: hypothetical protein IPK44_26255 [Candidatus Accumulibacter sp.]|nr:hypothetical protein [Accumulibacter sp.]
MILPEEIVSGGQTGDDGAALGVALDLGIPAAAGCPRGDLPKTADRWAIPIWSRRSMPGRTPARP